MLNNNNRDFRVKLLINNTDKNSKMLVSQISKLRMCFQDSLSLKGSRVFHKVLTWEVHLKISDCHFKVLFKLNKIK